MLNSRVVSLALAVTAELIYLACALAFYLFPERALGFFNAWLHGVDLAKIVSSRAVTATDFVTGFIGVFAAAYIAGVIFTALYNTFYRVFGRR